MYFVEVGIVTSVVEEPGPLEPESLGSGPFPPLW